MGTSCSLSTCLKISEELILSVIQCLEILIKVNLFKSFFKVLAEHVCFMLEMKSKDWKAEPL